jgi:hypothetical protein
MLLSVQIVSERKTWALFSWLWSGRESDGGVVVSSVSVDRGVGVDGKRTCGQWIVERGSKSRAHACNGHGTGWAGGRKGGEYTTLPPTFLCDSQAETSNLSGFAYKCRDWPKLDLRWSSATRMPV